MSIEKDLVKVGSLIPSMEEMVGDLRESSIISLNFQQFLLQKIDMDDIDVDDALRDSIQRKSFSATVINPATWPCISLSIPYCTLRLPRELESMRVHFDHYYNGSHGKVNLPEKSSGVCNSSLKPKKLSWCFGLGTVVLRYCSPCRDSFTLELNEPQAALILLFNRGNGRNSLTFRDISDELNLPLEVVRGIVTSLCNDPSKPQLLKIHRSSKGMNSGSSFDNATDHISFNEFSLKDTNRAAHRSNMNYSRNFFHQSQDSSLQIVKDFRRQVLDAMILRVLKRVHQRDTDHIFMIDDSGGIMKLPGLTADLLVNRVLEELKRQSEHVQYSSGEIMSRCDYLSSIQFLFKGLCSLDEDRQWTTVGFCYLSEGKQCINDVGKGNENKCIASVPLGNKLFDRLFSVLKLHDNELNNIDENSFYESKDCASVTSDQFANSFVNWIAHVPILLANAKEISVELKQNVSESIASTPSSASNNVLFHLLVHRIYNNFGVLMDQLNALIHQHALSVQDISVEVAETLPPTPIHRCFDTLEKLFLSEFREDSMCQDTLGIHRRLFLSFPIEVVTVFMNTFFKIVSVAQVHPLEEEGEEGVEVDRKGSVGKQDARWESFRVLTSEDMNNSKFEECWGVEYSIDTNHLTTLAIEDVPWPFVHGLSSFLKRGHSEVSRKATTGSSPHHHIEVVNISLHRFMMFVVHYSSEPLEAHSKQSSRPETVSSPFSSAALPSLAMKGKGTSGKNKRPNQMDRRKGKSAVKRPDLSTPSSFSASSSSAVLQSRFLSNQFLSLSGLQSIFSYHTSNAQDYTSDSTSSHRVDDSTSTLLSQGRIHSNEGDTDNREQSKWNFSPSHPHSQPHNQDINKLYLPPAEQQPSIADSIESSPTFAILREPSSLIQLLQVYYSAFLHQITSIFTSKRFQDQKSVQSVAGIDAAVLCRHVTHWFDKICLSMSVSNEEACRDIFWLRATVHVNTRSLLLSAFTWLDSNKDQLLTEDDFCSVGDDSGVVDSNQPLLKDELCEVEAAAVLESTGWNSVPESPMTTLQLADTFSDHEKVKRGIVTTMVFELTNSSSLLQISYSVGFEELVQNTHTMMNVSIEKAINLLSICQWDFNILTEKWFNGDLSHFISEQSLSTILTECEGDKQCQEEEGELPEALKIKCSNCSAFRPYADMCALQCRHYFCKDCWVAAITQSLGDESGGAAVLSCLHGESFESSKRRSVLDARHRLFHSSKTTCSCIVESDFVSQLLGMDAGRRFLQERKRRAVEQYVKQREDVSSSIASKTSMMIDPSIVDFTLLCRTVQNSTLSLKQVDVSQLSDSLLQGSFIAGNKLHEIFPDLDSYSLLKLEEYSQKLKITQTPVEYWNLRSITDIFGLVLIGSSLITNYNGNCLLHACPDVKYVMGQFVESIVKMNLKLRSSWVKSKSLSVVAMKEVISNRRTLLYNVCRMFARFNNTKVDYRCIDNKDSSSAESCPNLSVSISAGYLPFGDTSSSAVNILPLEGRYLFKPTGLTWTEIIIDIGEVLQRKTASPDADRMAQLLGKAMVLIEEKSSPLTNGEVENLFQAMLQAVDVFYESAAFCINLCKFIRVISESFGIDLTSPVMWSHCCKVAVYHLNNVNVSSRCLKAMLAVIEAREENKRSWLQRLESDQSFCTELLKCLHQCLEKYQNDETVSVVVLKILQHVLESPPSEDSYFITAKTYEVMIETMIRFLHVEDMKECFAVSVGRMAMCNKLLQERLKDLLVYENLIDIANGAASSAATKWVFWALGCLVQFYPSGQNKFAACGGCRIFAHAIKNTGDVQILSVILRSLATVASQSISVQQLLLEENVLQALLERRDGLKETYLETQLSDQKSLIKQLFIAFKHVLDILRQSNSFSLEDDIYDFKYALEEA